jgi:hypothetical protein
MAFITHYGYFEYVLMPFNLINTFVIFQHLMNDLFREYLDDFMVCYINDIFIFSKNMADHKHHVHLMLEKLWEVGLYAKLEKWEFHRFKVEFLGYIVSRNDICMDCHKVQTIVDWTTPTSIRSVQCFLIFNHFYRCFIAHYFIIMTPLTHLTWKDQPFSWGG